MAGILEELEQVIGRKIRQNEPMTSHSSLQEGGTAEYFVEATKIDEIVQLVRKARALKIVVYLFGSASLVAIPDETIKGLVIKNSCRKFDKASFRGTIKNNKVGVEEVLVFAEAGVIMNQLVRFTIDESLSGLEYQLGLPGTVGGAIYSNAKYRQKKIFLRKSLHSLTMLMKNGEIKVFTGKFPKFTGSSGIWNEAQDIILSAIFRLVPFADKNLLWVRGTQASTDRSSYYG